MSKQFSPIVFLPHSFHAADFHMIMLNSMQEVLHVVVLKEKDKMRK
jgi:hypothetical protein